MKSKHMFNPKLSLTARVIISVVSIWTLSISVNAQKSLAPEAAAADIDQCRNGTLASPAVCTGSAWVNGSANATQAHYAESQFIPYRIKITGLTPGATVHTLTIGYDVKKGIKHALDYLGTFNTTETTANPCSGVASCTLGSPTSTFPIPADTVTVTNQTNPNTNLPVDQVPGQFTMWGANILSASYEPYGGGDERQITLTFTASVSDPVIAWSGHIAWIGDWGEDNSANSIGGAPYHMRLIALNGSGGHQDRGLMAEAVIPSGAVFIKKVVNTLDGSGNAVLGFPFTATSNFGTTNFSLIDDNAGPGIDTKGSQAIVNFGPLNSITITENAGPFGWTLADVNCDEKGLQDSTKSPSLGPAVAIVQPGELVTCTFTNTQLIPSSAMVSVSGRVVDSTGRSLSGVRITLTDSNDNVRTAISSNFGYYRFEEVESGQLYVISAASKRYTFQTHVLSVLDDVTEFNITSIE